jgi:hypothetical protein
VACKESFFLNTVAGPCRTHTGFPVKPSRAPQNLYLIYQSDSIRLISHQEIRQPLHRTDQLLLVHRRSVIDAGGISTRQKDCAGARRARMIAARITAGWVTATVWPEYCCPASQQSTRVSKLATDSPPWGADSISVSHRLTLSKSLA